MDTMFNHPGIMAAFGIIVVVMLLLDLGIFNKHSHKIGNREALIWSLTWISLAMAFSGLIYYTMGLEKFSQFQSAYWIEKALSVDNLFVFILVFNFFNVPAELHHKVLFWGVIGALVFRALFIFTGVGLINMTYLPVFYMGGLAVRINVLLVLFGAFLVVAGCKSWFVKEEDQAQKDFNKSPGARLIRRFFKVSDNYRDDHFFSMEQGVKMATPLFVVLGVIEFTDLLFAVDSIPAIFAVAPNDPLILYSSNIFAILGLRALYFLLANFMHYFSRLKYGLALILVFIGVKMIISPVVHIPSPISLAVVAGILLLAVFASIAFPKKEA